MANAAALVPIIVEALSKAASFEAGQPVTIAVPAESTTIDVPQFGRVEVAESGTTLTIRKA